MKISSASKKVLASALSAAMVVAFSPALAFGDTSYITDWDGQSTGITDANAYAAGYAFKTVANSGGRLVAKYYKAEDVLSAGAVDFTMLGNVEIKEAGKVVKLADGATLNLGGFTLSSSYENDGVQLLTVGSGGAVENGTVEAADYTADDGKTPKYVTGIKANSAGTVNIKNVVVDAISGGSADITAQGTVTVAGTVAADSLTVAKSAKVATGAITANVIMKEAASLEATATNAKGKATAITGDLTYEGKNAAVIATAETTGNTFFDSAGNPEHRNMNAVAIDGEVTMHSHEGVSLTASAKTTGADDAATGETANAIALSSGAVTATKKQTLKVSASVADSYAAATGIEGTLVTSAGAAVDVAAKGSTENGDKDVAVKGALTAATGTFTGKIGAGSRITGGTYTMDPAAYVNTNVYDIIDNGDTFTVKKAEGFTFVSSAGSSFGTADEQQLIINAALAALDGKSGAATLKYAEGYDLAKARDLSEANKLKIVIKSDGTVTEKRATDAQKAAFDGLAAYAEKNSSSKPAWDSVLFTSAQIYFNDANNDSAFTKVADLADFGATGTRNSKANTINVTALATSASRLIQSDGNGDYLTAGDYSKYVASGAVLVAADEAGTVAPVEFVKGSDNKYRAFVSTSPLAITEMTIDMSAIKDDVDKPETPAAPEKATQGIDVSKKSRTVKIGSKTKTKKALYFKMGASAETELATAKKSGSSRITVSGDKVTLKKGTKKGVYTAKVSLKAAGSDEYLAAAKTITVKFVVKK